MPTNDLGSEAWLKQLFVALTTEPSEDLNEMTVNPYHAVNFSERLQGEHEPLVDEAMWLAANVKLMNELGIEDWLFRLLEVLETGGVEA